MEMAQDLMQAHSVWDNCASCSSDHALSSNCSTATHTSSRCEDAASETCCDSDTSAISSDDEQAAEADTLKSVQWHLELMNVAAEDTNAAQLSLNQLMEMKSAQMERWAMTEDRLTRSIGVDCLAKAKPWLDAIRACRSARAIVAAASEHYIEFGSGAPEGKLSDLMASHADALATFQDAQNILCQLQQKKRFSPTRLAALRPYLEADEEHSAKMAKIHDSIKQSEQNLNFSKERYRHALRSLEELSEETRRRRGRLVTVDDV